RSLAAARRASLSFEPSFLIRSETSAAAAGTAAQATSRAAPRSVRTVVVLGGGLREAPRLIEDKPAAPRRQLPGAAGRLLGGDPQLLLERHAARPQPHQVLAGGGRARVAPPQVPDDPVQPRPGRR